MKKLIFFLCLNLIILQNLFPQEIFLTDTTKTGIHLNSRQSDLLKIIRNRSSSNKVSIIKSASINKMKSLKEIGIEVFDKGIVKFKNKSIKTVDETTSIWIGENGESNIILAFTGEDITGSIFIPFEKFKIEPLGNGIHVLIKFDESHVPQEKYINLKEGLSDSLKSAQLKTRSEDNSNNLNKVNTTTSISLLVAYTQSAANACGNIQGLIQTAVAEAEQSYSNSGVNIDLEVVHTTLVNYTETDTTDTDLNRFKNPSDGYMDNIHSLRDQYSADICVLIMNDTDACGQSYTLLASESTAFCAVSYQYATGYYSFAHEIGHLLGACEQRNFRINPEFPYGHGYCSPSPSSHWRTIMAVDLKDDCDCEGSVRIQYWSNPYKTFFGLAMGTVDYENNARVLNEKANTIANFRIAPTTSGTLASSETWIWNTLTGNITVPGGVTLLIPDNSQVYLVNGTSNYSITSTGGSIIVGNTAIINGLKAKTKSSNAIKGLYSTVQSALDNSSAGYTVDIVSDTYNENISVSNKNNLTIAGAIDGITSFTGSFTANNCNNLFLASATLKQLSVNYCSPCTLWCNIEGNLSQSGLSIYSSNLYNHKGDVYNCTTGLNANSTTGYVEYSDYSASSCNIYASSGSNITADYDWFCSPVTTDFIAVSSAYINPSGSYFPAGRPISSGNVAIPSPRFSCTAKKNANFDESKDFPNSQILSDDPAKDEFSKVNDSYFSLMKKTKDNPKSREMLKNEMPDILKAYKAFIKKNPQSSLSRTALTTTANSYWLTEDYNGRKSFLDEIINDKELASLKGYAESMMIDNYIKAKDADGAISAADAFMEKYKNDGELICEGLMKKGLVLTYELNQAEKAAECFTAIVKNYPESPLAEFAKNSLASLGQEVKESPEKNTSGEMTGFSAGAYPNPFNPSTTIKYSLPENCRVSLEVYNILGEKAASLVNETKSAGSYSAVFNGSSLASGIYIYKITAVSIETGKQFVKSDKIMLVK